MNKRQGKVAVSTNLWTTSLTQLQVISYALAREGRVEVLIQAAVDEYIERITETPKFAKKLRALRARNVTTDERVNSALDELVRMTTRGIRVVEPKGKATVIPFAGR